MVVLGLHVPAAFEPHRASVLGPVQPIVEHIDEIAGVCIDDGQFAGYADAMYGAMWQTTGLAAAIASTAKIPWEPSRS